jgi:hypothetical protein
MGRANEAVADLQTAIRVARATEDPALFLRGATALLPVDGSDALSKEASATAHRIFERLPNDTMRERFRTALPLRRLGDLIGAVPMPGKELGK